MLIERVMGKPNFRRISSLGALVLGLGCGLIAARYGYIDAPTNFYAWNLHQWAQWSVAAAVLLVSSLWLGTRVVRTAGVLFVMALLAAAIKPAWRIIDDPIDWYAKTVDQYPGDLMGNAYLCEPSTKQLAIDRRHSGSREALRHLASHYMFCDPNQEQTNDWLRKLAAKNDVHAIVLLSDLAEADGRHQEAEEWDRRATSLGYDRKAESEKMMRKLSH